MRGCIRGAVAPLTLHSVAKAVGLDGSSASAGPTLSSVVEQLVAEGQVAGQLRGGGTTWLPAIHAQRQLEDLMHSFRCRPQVRCSLRSALLCLWRMPLCFNGDVKCVHLFDISRLLHVISEATSRLSPCLASSES